MNFIWLNLIGCHRKFKKKIYVYMDGDVPGVPYMGYTYLNLLDSPQLLQILVTLTAVINPLLPNFLGRAIVILNFVRHFRNFIADSALVEKYNVGLKTLLQQGISEPEFYGDKCTDLEKL